MKTRTLALAVISASIAAAGALAVPAQAADSGPMKNCGKLGNIAKQVQTVANCDEARVALTAFMAEGGKAATEKGISCYWLVRNDKKVICTWDDKKRGGGSAAVLYADALIAASSSASK